MNQDKPEITLNESVAEVMRSLPPAIQEYLAQERYTPIAKGLMTKYQLRIDQGGVLEREIMLLLMGIENPDEFTQTLAEEARLDQQTINGITHDVNDQIFVPLQEEMKRSGSEVPMTPKVEQQTAKPVIPQPQKYFHLENKIPPPPRPVQIPVDNKKLLEDHEEPHTDLSPPPRPVTPAKPYSDDPYHEPIEV